jgi:hypothetical protein
MPRGGLDSNVSATLAGRQKPRSIHRLWRSLVTWDSVNTRSSSARSGCSIVASNDEVERRGFAATLIEGSLSRSSNPSLAPRRCDPRDRSNRLLDGRQCDYLCDTEENSFSAEARARAMPSSVNITDLFLFFGSSMRPRSCNRFDASQSIPFPRAGHAMFFLRSEVQNGQYRFVNPRFVVTHRSAFVRSPRIMRSLKPDVKSRDVGFLERGTYAPAVV